MNDGCNSTLRHHYVFLHVALRQLAHSCPLQVMGILASDKKNEFLDDMLKGVDEQLGESSTRDFQATDISVHCGRVGDKPCALIEMPEPKEPTEGYFAAIVLQTKMPDTPDEEDHKNARISYFVAEKPVPLPGAPPTMFCEWDRAGSHCLYGNGPEPTVADVLDQSLSTIQKWSSQFHWSERLLAFEAGCLQNQAQAQAGSRQKQAADWNRRNTECLEQQWQAIQKLLATSQCYLETVDEQQLAKMSLSQATHAIQAASDLSRAVLKDAKATPEQSAYNPATDPEFLANWEKLYGGRFASANPANAHALNQSDSPTPNQSV